MATAAQHGMDGKVSSSHCETSLDYAPSGMDTLIELREAYRDAFDKVDVHVEARTYSRHLGSSVLSLGCPSLICCRMDRLTTVV